MPEKTVDEIVRDLERDNLTHRYFMSLGSTDEQAAAASAYAAKAKLFKFDGAVLSFNEKPVNDPECGVVEYLKTNKLDFLLPPPKAKDADAPDIDPKLVEAARTNLTAKGRLYKEVGPAMAETLLAAKPADKAADKPAPKGPNPWRAGEWNVTAQGRIVKANRELAAKLATSANSYIGATKPSRAA